MAHTRDDVLAAVAASFPESRRTHVLDLLDGYGVTPYTPEKRQKVRELFETWPGATHEFAGMMPDPLLNADVRMRGSPSRNGLPLRRTSTRPGGY